jgi:aldose 1-epimerase
MNKDPNTKISSTLASARKEPPYRVKVKDFGILSDGRKVTEYVLNNKVGTRIAIINLGATISQIQVADKNDDFADIVLGFDNPQQYLTDSSYFGAVVGRYGNRIAKGKFTLDEQCYTLNTNNDENHLHGGILGFNKRLWNGKVSDAYNNCVTLTLQSQDGDEGYPGTLDVTVTYTLTENNNLVIEYHATTDKATIINLMQHTYFNLAGHNSGDILKHQLSINAKHYTPVNSELIPTGKFASVVNTAFDFTKAKPIGTDIYQGDQQLVFGLGYDHNWVLNSNAGQLKHAAAKVYDPYSGRTLNVYTDQPGVQFYTGNVLDGSILGKNNTVYKHRNGFCLETQHFPDSPNIPHFPKTHLKPNEIYTSKTIFSFGVQ